MSPLQTLLFHILNNHLFCIAISFPLSSVLIFTSSLFFILFFNFLRPLFSELSRFDHSWFLPVFALSFSIFLCSPPSRVSFPSLFKLRRRGALIGRSCLSVGWLVGRSVLSFLIFQKEMFWDIKYHVFSFFISIFFETCCIMFEVHCIGVSA